jgi:hypothetical protein
LYLENAAEENITVVNVLFQNFSCVSCIMEILLVKYTVNVLIQNISCVSCILKILRVKYTVNVLFKIFLVFLVSWEYCEWNIQWCVIQNISCASCIWWYCEWNILWMCYSNFFLCFLLWVNCTLVLYSSKNQAKFNIKWWQVSYHDIHRKLTSNLWETSE